MNKLFYLFSLCLLLTTATLAAERDMKQKFDVVLKENLVEALATSLSLQIPMVLVDLIAQYCLEKQWIKYDSNATPGIEVREVAISGNGKYFALSSTTTKTNLLRLYDLETGKAIIERPVSLKNISLSHDGQYLMGKILTELFCWNTSNNKITKFGSGIYALSPNSQQVALSQTDLEIEIFDIATRKAIAYLMSSDTQSMVYSPRGKYLAVSTKHSLISIFDLITTERVQVIDVMSAVHEVDNLKFSPEGNLLLWREGHDTTVWDIYETHAELRTMKKTYGSSFLSDGTSVLSITNSGASMKIWDIYSGTVVHTIPSEVNISSAHISPCNKIILGVDVKGYVHKWKMQHSYKIERQITGKKITSWFKRTKK